MFAAVRGKFDLMDRCGHRSRLLDDIELLSTMVAAAQISTMW